MNNSFEKLEINHSTKDKSFIIHNFKPTVNDLGKNVDIKFRNENKLIFISNGLENISLNKGITQILKFKNKKSLV